MYAGVNRIDMVFLEALFWVTDSCASRLFPTRLFPQLARGEREGLQIWRLLHGNIRQRKPGTPIGTFVTHAQNLTVAAKYSQRLLTTCLLKLCETVMAAVILYVPSSDSASFAACSAKNVWPLQVDDVNMAYDGFLLRCQTRDSYSSSSSVARQPTSGAGLYSSSRYPYLLLYLPPSYIRQQREVTRDVFPSHSWSSYRSSSMEFSIQYFFRYTTTIGQAK
jgi:hypothetical protein